MLSLSLACLLLCAIDNVAHQALARPTMARPMVPVPDIPKAITPRHAPFESVRTRLKKDHSGTRGDPAGKYFHESTFHAHYDGRFADKTVPEVKRHSALTYLAQTYLSTMASLGAETWLMHGSLLGWWWNRAIMPWDTDIDVQMSMESMEYLAAFHNMTVHHFKLPKLEGEGNAEDTEEEKREETEEEKRDESFRDYLLEINPNYRNGSTKDRLNVIDARWIDMETGLFIDITTVRPNVTAREIGLDGHLMCKDGHHYLEQDIFPLRSSKFENIPVKIPYAYSELLEEEYGRKSLTKTSFEGHVFDQHRMEWVPVYAAGWRGRHQYTRPASQAKPGTVVNARPSRKQKVKPKGNEIPDIIRNARPGSRDTALSESTGNTSPEARRNPELELRDTRIPEARGSSVFEPSTNPIPEQRRHSTQVQGWEQAQERRRNAEQQRNWDTTPEQRRDSTQTHSWESSSEQRRNAEQQRNWDMAPEQRRNTEQQRNWDTTPEQSRDSTQTHNWEPSSEQRRDSAQADVWETMPGKRQDSGQAPSWEAPPELRRERTLEQRWDETSEQRRARLSYRRDPTPERIRNIVSEQRRNAELER